MGEGEKQQLAHRMRVGGGGKGMSRRKKRDIQTVFVASTSCFSHKMMLIHVHVCMLTVCAILLTCGPSVDGMDYNMLASFI